MDKRQRIMQNVFLLVYFCVSIATFYHTSWGFGTIMGNMPTDIWGKVGWWLMGGLSAFAIDVGMGAIVLSMVWGKRDEWLTGALIALATFSAYAQVVYSSHHATEYALGTVAPWLQWLEVVLDARVLIMPLMLPAFLLTFAFAAKSYHLGATHEELQPKIIPEPANDVQLDKLPEPEPVAQPEKSQPIPMQTQTSVSTDERRKIVLKRIQGGNLTDQETVANEFDVARSTISRDISYWERQGMVARQGNDYIYVGGNGHAS